MSCPSWFIFPPNAAPSTNLIFRIYSGPPGLSLLALLNLTTGSLIRSVPSQLHQMLDGADALGAVHFKLEAEKTIDRFWASFVTAHNQNERSRTREV